MGSIQEVIDTTAVAVRDNADIVRAEDFMPLMTVEQAVQRKGMMNQFIGKVLKDGDDYGTMPGGQTKKVLMKPGAEKLCSIFGLAPKYHKEVIVEDWTGAQHGGEPLFSYEYRCQLWRGGRFMGEAIGSCNSWESKYRYRWVQEDAAKDRQDFERLPRRGGVKTIFEPLFALERKQTDGQYGKPAEYWEAFEQAILNKTARFIEEKQLGKKKFDGWEMQVDTVQYRVPNPDVADVINTCMKMAQKRALVAAVLVVTNCSDAFTQDLEEDMEPHAPRQEQGEPAPADKPADTKAAKRKPPKQLEKVFADIDGGKLDAAVTAYTAFEREYIRKGGDAGYELYGKIASRFTDKYPNGTTDKEAHKAFLLELHDALEMLEPPHDVAQEAK